MGTLPGRCGLIEADPVGRRVDELHLPILAGTWPNARVEERVVVLVEFGVQRVEIAHHDGTAVPGVPSSWWEDRWSRSAARETCKYTGRSQSPSCQSSEQPR